MTSSTLSPPRFLADYRPGARVVECLLRDLEVTLSPDAASSLWGEVQAVLQSGSGQEAVAEALTSGTGSLDTAPREEVLDAMGLVLVGQPWPANRDDSEDREAFLAALGLALSARGAQECPQA